MSFTKAISKSLVSSPERQKEADEDLAARKVQDGDVDAFDALILKYRERVYSVIYNLTSNREDINLTRNLYQGLQSINDSRVNPAFSPGSTASPSTPRLRI